MRGLILGLMRRLSAGVAGLLLAVSLTAPPLAAEPVRIGQFTVPLSRQGPGLLLRDIRRGEDEEIAATVAIIARVRPDILMLSGIDYDLDGVALAAFADLLRNAGIDYPHSFADRPNSGTATGLDLDGDGRLGGARDAQGYGRFAGQGGLAILSRFPIDDAGVRDFSLVLWRDMPTVPMADDGTPILDDRALPVQRLSSTSHWSVPVALPGGETLRVLTFHATPPVFDGPEDRNGLRNAAEIDFWRDHLDDTGGPFAMPDDALFVIAGVANLDPVDGDGRHYAIRNLLAHPRLQDPRPRSDGGAEAADADQDGDPALDTADWPDGAPGNLRVSYVLPSVTLDVVDAGVFWPEPFSRDAALLGSGGQAAGRHRLVWVDVEVPDTAPETAPAETGVEPGVEPDTGPLSTDSRPPDAADTDGTDPQILTPDDPGPAGDISGPPDRSDRP